MACYYQAEVDSFFDTMSGRLLPILTDLNRLQATIVDGDNKVI
jgi:hypothetical protein